MQSLGFTVGADLNVSSKGETEIKPHQSLEWAGKEPGHACKEALQQARLDHLCWPKFGSGGCANQKKNCASATNVSRTNRNMRQKLRSASPLHYTAAPADWNCRVCFM